jgi:hypothetical protein
MRMTIEISSDVRRLLVGAATALVLWFGGMAALVFVVEPPALIAFGPSARLLGAAVGADASLIAVGRGFIAARAEQPGLARRLYANGAWFVWPALPPTCGTRRAIARAI